MKTFEVEIATGKKPERVNAEAYTLQGGVLVFHTLGHDLIKAYGVGAWRTLRESA